jgi:hypothetical protein
MKKDAATEKRQAEQKELEKERPADDTADDAADDTAPDTAIELDAWIESIGLDNEEDYNCYIYRIVKGYRKGAKTYCHKFKNETPDLDTIAERFGPGLYEICITRRIRGKWTPKKYTIEIDPAACPGAGAPAGQGNAPSGGAVQVGIDIVRQVMQIMQPILDVSAQVKAAAPAPGADGLKPITTAFSEMMAEIIKIQSKATQEIMSMQNARMIEQADIAGDDGADDEPEQEDFTKQISSIVDMVKKGYALLTSPAGAGVVESTKAKPEFQALASDPTKKGAITKALIKEIGKVKAGKVLELFGITA